jgi:hypothetical protein
VKTASSALLASRTYTRTSHIQDAGEIGSKLSARETKVQQEAGTDTCTGTTELKKRREDWYLKRRIHARMESGEEETQRQ